MKYEAARFLDDLMNEREPRWLSLLGKSGTGKTMLTKIIARWHLKHRHYEVDKGPSVATRSGTKPFGAIVRHRGGFINWGKAINERMLRGDYDFIEDLCSYSFFAIDDIASEYEKHRSLSASKLYHIFESRLNKWTVITANLSLDQVSEVLDARIASRMLRNKGVVVDVTAQDFNLRQQT